MVWSHFADGAQVLKVWNENDTCEDLTLGSMDCTAIHPRITSNYGDHLLLTRGGIGDVDLVQVVAGSGSYDLALTRNTGGDVFDTHADTGKRPVELSQVGDYDMDGEDDMLLVVSGGSDLEMVYVMTRPVHEQTLLAASASGPSLTALTGSNVEYSVTMELGSQLASHTVLMQMYVLKDPSSSSSELEWLGGQQYSIPSSSTSHTFDYTFDGAGWDEAKPTSLRRLCRWMSILRAR